MRVGLVGDYHLLFFGVILPALIGAGLTYGYYGERLGYPEEPMAA